MTFREKEALQRFCRLNPKNQDAALAIVQAVQVAEKSTEKVVYERLSGTVPAHTPGSEGLPGAGIRA